MLKSLRLILVAMLMAASTPLFGGEPDKQLHQKCIYPTVMIYCTNPKVSSCGTGVILKSVKKDKDKYLNLVGTCAHILTKSPAVYANTYDKDDPTLLIESKMVSPPKYEYMLQIGVYKEWSKLVGVERFNCKIEVADTKKDIALITFESTKELPAVDIDPNPALFIGNEVYRIGCGIGMPFRLDYGKITSMAGSVGFMSGLEGTYRTSIATVSGDSGGPVFHNHKLIGVMQAVMSRNGQEDNMIFHMSYVIPLSRFMGSEEVRKFLKTEKEFESLIQKDEAKEPTEDELQKLLDELDSLN